MTVAVEYFIHSRQADNLLVCSRYNAFSKQSQRSLSSRVCRLAL